MKKMAGEGAWPILMCAFGVPNIKYNAMVIAHSLYRRIKRVCDISAGVKTHRSAPM